jgi:undecaprenyl-diphosphatase
LTLLQLVVVALVQGITEFLPISSSGHLVVLPALAGWPDQGLVIDIAVHVGTLCAVGAYLWRDLLDMLASLGRLLRGRPQRRSLAAGGEDAGRSGGARMILLVIVGTVPVVLAGAGLHVLRPDGIRAIEVVAWTTLGFGVVLYLADRLGMTLRRLEHLTVLHALVIGLAQALALVPGTSRAGITMTMARMLGYERADAARFSLLLAIPAILGAGTLAGWELYQAGDLQVGLDALLAALFAFGAALVAIAAMMHWLRRASFTPFVIYRLALGGALLAWLYNGSPALF